MTGPTGDTSQHNQPEPEVIAASGVYTAPDGQHYLIEFLDVALTCPDADHEHDFRCYEPAAPTAAAGRDTAGGGQS